MVGWRDEHEAKQKLEERLRIELFSALKARLPELESLLEKYDGHWGLEDSFYRFYHQSFKVYRLQAGTVEIVDVLRSLLPDRELNPDFLAILNESTGKTFEPAHNKIWPQITRPILEAFFHARYFLEMAIKYGRELEELPKVLPSGWAAFLYLYDLR
jgi:hypothetical protein